MAPKPAFFDIGGLALRFAGAAIALQRALQRSESRGRVLSHPRALKTL